MTVIVIPTAALWILVALAVINLGTTLYKLRLIRRVQKEKPWLHDGVVLPEDCTPRRFGAHRMEDWILCVKHSTPDAPDKSHNAVLSGKPPHSEF